MRTQTRAVICFLLFALALTVATVLGNLMHTRPLSLVFQRYSTASDHFQDVAFLLLSNASSRLYMLGLTGGTNSAWMGITGDFSTVSYLVNCEFRDETPHGCKNWTQEPPPHEGTLKLALLPHSSQLLRIPMQQNGRKRKVAVLCVDFPDSQFGKSPATPWQRVRLLLWRAGIRTSVFHRVWCDRELWLHPPLTPLNNGVERTGVSRAAQLLWVARGRLAPAAHAER